MQTKQAGNSDLQLTRIGLGTWAIGGGGWLWGWGPQDDEASIKTIHHALDLGINWIDTAPVYGLGHAEEVVGRAIKGMRQRPLIATKCGRTWITPQELGGDLSHDAIKKEVEQSLQRLGIEVIDLYQIHWPRPDEDIEKAWGAIAELIKEGKVRYGGVSNFSVRQMTRVNQIHPITTLQPPYNMLAREIEAETLGYCGQHNIGVICYSPMCKGLLTGKFSAERVAGLAEDDHRRQDRHFREPELSINLQLVEKLKAVAARSGHTTAQLAVAWTLARPETTAAIVGGRRPDQIEEIVPAGDWQLTDTEQAEITALLAERDAALAKLQQ